MVYWKSSKLVLRSTNGTKKPVSRDTLLAWNAAYDQERNELLWLGVQEGHGSSTSGDGNWSEESSPSDEESFSFGLIFHRNLGNTSLQESSVQVPLEGKQTYVTFKTCPLHFVLISLKMDCRRVTPLVDRV